MTTQWNLRSDAWQAQRHAHTYKLFSLSLHIYIYIFSTLSFFISPTTPLIFAHPASALIASAPPQECGFEIVECIRVGWCDRVGIRKIIHCFVVFTADSKAGIKERETSFLLYSSSSAVTPPLPVCIQGSTSHKSIEILGHNRKGTFILSQGCVFLALALLQNPCLDW